MFDFVSWILDFLNSPATVSYYVAISVELKNRCTDNYILVLDKETTMPCPVCHGKGKVL